jgi:ribosomal protein L16 Arg81 hydroxylase
MKTNELITALKEQEETLKQFLDCSISKQKAIVKNDIENLHNSLNTEEKILFKIENNGKKITSVLKSMADEFGVKLDHISLSEFLNSVLNKTEINVNVINLLRNSIKDLINRSSKINEQNKILIDHSRNFLRETIAVIIGLSKHPLLDRKI